MTTVADVLAEPRLGLLAVHLPHPEAPVRWVATSELVDPSPFLEGGEVLLTTGLETREWGPEWEDYVQRLGAGGAGVAALGLAAGLTHERSPHALLIACQRHGVNLFEVPEETTFVAVSRHTARLLEARERALAEEALAGHRRLAEAALVGGTGTLLRRLAEAGGGAAALLGPDGAPGEGPVGPAVALLDVTAAAREAHRMRSRGLRAASSSAAGGSTLLVHPVGISGQPTGYLAAAFPGRVGVLQRGLVSTAVALLSLDAERGRTRQELDRRLRGRALELLLAGDAVSARLLLSARSPAASSRLPATGAVLRATGPRRRLGDALAATEEGLPLSAVQGGELVVVVPPRQARATAEALAGRGLRVGVGESAPLDRLGSSAETARHALEATTAATPVASWDDHVRRGALSLVEPGRAAAFARSFLAPLDGDRREELVATLHSFLRHHGSQLRVAADLGVHRNTVRHRLRLVERLLGVSLDDPQVRVNAWIALQASARVGPTGG